MAAISTYRIRGPWATGPSWETLSTTYSWQQLSELFVWPDLTIGEIDAKDIESIRIERRMSDVFNRHRVAKAHLVLDNHLGTYSPGVNSSMRPNRPISVHAEIETGSVYQLFTGVIESIQLDPRLGARKLLIECSDNAVKLRNKTEQTIKENVPISSLYVSVAESAGIPRARMLVDAINEKVPVAFLDEQSAADAFEILKNTSASVMYPDGRGRLHVRDRNYDVNLTNVCSHGEFFSFDYELGTDRLVNVARIIGENRQPTEISTVAWIDEAISINSGERVNFNLVFVDPVTLEDRTPVNSIVSPVDSSDYVFTVTQSEDAVNVSSSLLVAVNLLALSAHVQIDNNGPAGYLRKFQIRGVPLVKQPPIETVGVNSASQIAYDDREREIESPIFPNRIFTKTYSEWLSETYGEPTPEIAWSLKNEDEHLLHHELGDIVTLTNTIAGVGSRYQVVGLTHQIVFTKNGVEHRTIHEARLSPLKNYLILDADPEGRLDADRTWGF